MEIETYHQLFQYLKQLTYPPNLTPSQQLAIQKQAQHYFIQNQQLYRRNRKNPSQPLLVIKTNEVEQTLHNIHNEPLGGHLARDITYNKIASRYYWPGMYKTIDNWIRTCDVCQRQGRPKPKEPLHPIPVGQPFDRVGIDYVGPLPRTTKGNRYIIVATEYLTKWVEASATPDCTAQITA